MFLELSAAPGTTNPFGFGTSPRTSAPSSESDHTPRFPLLPLNTRDRRLGDRHRYGWPIGNDPCGSKKPAAQLPATGRWRREWKHRSSNELTPGPDGCIVFPRGVARAQPATRNCLDPCGPRKHPYTLPIRDVCADPPIFSSIGQTNNHGNG